MARVAEKTVKSSKGEVYAGTSDAAAERATGRTWKTWFSLLDRAGAKRMTHPQIVSIVSEKYRVGPWWQQMIVVGYEQARGMRKVHERPGGFQIGATRTMAVAAARVYTAWTDSRQRSRWLPRAKMVITKATPRRTLRVQWAGGPSRIDVTFTSKGRSKSTVVVTHANLSTAVQAERMKKYWGEALRRLEGYLE